MPTIAVLDWDSLSGKSETNFLITGSSMYLLTVNLSSVMSESSLVSAGFTYAVFNHSHRKSYDRFVPVYD